MRRQISISILRFQSGVPKFELPKKKSEKIFHPKICFPIFFFTLRFDHYLCRVGPQNVHPPSSPSIVTAPMFPKVICKDFHSRAISAQPIYFVPISNHPHHYTQKMICRFCPSCPIIITIIKSDLQASLLTPPLNPLISSLSVNNKFVLSLP